MSRLFDPVSLLNQDLPEGETRRTLLPQGEVIAQITKIAVKSGTISKGDKAGEDWNRLDVSLEITDPEYLEHYADGSFTKANTNLGLMIDLTETGQIAMGPNRNIRLNRLREAAGVNGKPLSMLSGQFIRITIGHKPHPTDSEIVLDEVTGFAKV
jgi:hypothetical protein